MKSSLSGVYWSRSGGEADGAAIENYIAVDGIENVIKILEEIEDDKVSGIDFIELSACLGVKNFFFSSAHKEYIKNFTQQTMRNKRYRFGFSVMFKKAGV